jgi:hypothetical protein
MEVSGIPASRKPTSNNNNFLSSISGSHGVGQFYETTPRNIQEDKSVIFIQTSAFNRRVLLLQ